jgi:hypothetical protein
VAVVKSARTRTQDWYDDTKPENRHAAWVDWIALGFGCAAAALFAFAFAEALYRAVTR